MSKYTTIRIAKRAKDLFLIFACLKDKHQFHEYNDEHKSVLIDEILCEIVTNEHKAEHRAIQWANRLGVKC